VVNDKINPDLPKQLRVNFIHYDVKAKIKEERNFPHGLFAIAKDAITKVGFFSVHNKKGEKTSRIKIQKGVIRTNCIDSLDRTNFA
jgi:hypothetical protein